MGRIIAIPAVREMRLGVLAPGGHRFTLTGTLLAPGLYHAQVRFGAERIRMKFVTTR